MELLNPNQTKQDKALYGINGWLLIIQFIVLMTGYIQLRRLIYNIQNIPLETILSVIVCVLFALFFYRKSIHFRWFFIIVMGIDAYQLISVSRTGLLPYYVSIGIIVGYVGLIVGLFVSRRAKNTFHRSFQEDA